MSGFRPYICGGATDNTVPSWDYSTTNAGSPQAWRIDPLCRNSILPALRRLLNKLKEVILPFLAVSRGLLMLVKRLETKGEWGAGG